MAIAFLNEAAPLEQAGGPVRISNLLHMVWLSRPDLQQAFDLRTADGRNGLIHWFNDAAQREYGIDPEAAAVAAEPPARISAPPASPSGISRLLSFLGLRPAGPGAGLAPGANLVGYAQGVLGMGEHVRMTAEALKAVGTPYGIVDFDVGVVNKQSELSDDYCVIDGNRHRANIFHVNADQMLNSYLRLGGEFFAGRYNIGYWAWELAKCPANWVPVTRMVDEIWAPSRFIQASFSAVADAPVVHMPLCVELPDFVRRERSHFGLPYGDRLFLYVFDFHSYLQRKNPYAAIRAFKQAFPAGTEAAGLVIKVMNGEADSPAWRAMIELIGGDRRIHVLNSVMSRSDVLALIDCCDSFISLHRAEGFGRGPAEAMYLGKPVIATNYSGTTDFMRPSNSYLVDYELVPIQPGEYVFPEGQKWAEADVSHATTHMRSIVDDFGEAKRIGALGQATIRQEFSAPEIGRRMTARLRELGML